MDQVLNYYNFMDARKSLYIGKFWFIHLSSPLLLDDHPITLLLINGISSIIDSHN